MHQHPHADAAVVGDKGQSGEPATRLNVTATSGRLPHSTGLNLSVSTAVLDEGIFCSLNDHMLDSSPTNNHIFSLVKLVV